MNTKLEMIIKKCIGNGAPSDGCAGCSCDEKECLLNILEEYNNQCDEEEIISYEE